MLTRYLPIFVFTLLFSACKNETPPTPKDQPVSVEQASSVGTSTNKNDVKPNEFTVDDAAAERIKNYLMHRFLAKDLSLMEESDKQFQLYNIDLNEDGISEYFVRFKSPYFCGSGGCTVLLLQNNLTLINRFSVMQTPLYVSKEKANGWRSFLVKSDGAFRKMDFDAKKYPDNPSLLADSGLKPSGHNQIVFDDKVPAKTYFFSEKPTSATQKGATQRRSMVFQRTYNAGNFAFKVNATNNDVTSVHISTAGLPRPYDETIEVNGGVKDGYLLDLNKDGFKELYLVIQPTDDSDNWSLLGVASYRDKGAGAIIIKDTEEPRQLNSDQLFTANGELKRSFIQKGQKVAYKYKLEKGETGFVLKPVRL